MFMFNVKVEVLSKNKVVDTQTVEADNIFDGLAEAHTFGRLLASDYPQSSYRVLYGTIFNTHIKVAS